MLRDMNELRSNSYMPQFHHKRPLKASAPSGATSVVRPTQKIHTDAYYEKRRQRRPARS